ncbi:hypothetical protein V496_10429, partial [Pseudogymnoascus sp. VKM F-4515 (FW-2607)]
MLSRSLFRAARPCCRLYSSTTGTGTAPPMLLKIRKDLKTAMQDKDKNKLNVLRALLSQSLNASKTNSPIVTDMQMLALVRKNAAASKQAAAEFVEAGRQDLADKEAEQMRVMEEYIGEVKTVGEEEIRK